MQIPKGPIFLILIAWWQAVAVAHGERLAGSTCSSPPACATSPLSLSSPFFVLQEGAVGGTGADPGQDLTPKGGGCTPGRCFNFHSGRGGGLPLRPPPSLPWTPSPPPPSTLIHLRIRVLGTFFRLGQFCPPAPSAHL